MRHFAFAALVLLTCISPPLYAQQDAQKSLPDEADKGIKTKNSGASGFVGEQEKSGSAAHVAGHLKHQRIAGK
jgi:hypothetical protein